MYVVVEYFGVFDDRDLDDEVVGFDLFCDELFEGWLVVCGEE